MKKLAMILVLVLCSVVILSSQVMAQDASPIEWVDQFNTDSVDYPVWISVDATEIYTDGYTDDIFPGQSGVSFKDTFISMYNPDSKAIFTISSGEEEEATVKVTFGAGDDALTATVTKI